ncbi:malate synthase A [Paenibacillus thiaminolyticus]|uniref:malate synthase A n=1 Tax=Paenibacillus thiaminolyticus TaxID=49283 RepID=UPI001162EBE6|nr:malate synthase A [Paenibacillus thiaminolyticus]NGP58255.1 malate synthase A [Paenibacillus thiaminolyticus]
MNRVSQSDRELKGDCSSDAHRVILTPKALDFVTALERRFGKRRKELLHMRDERQQRLDAGEWPGFLAETAQVRNADWTVASIPADLQDRRVEITGPSGDRKMVINALNSGAKVFMADFEDANSPTWSNTLEGQVNLRDAVNRTIRFVNETGKIYELNEEPAVLKVRPRGWHMEEKHLLIDGQPISASLFDFGLYFFHNAKTLIRQGSGPYFYLPKMESHLEARLWNDVFEFAQQELGIPRGTIKATVLIETILAAFEMDEILFELRDHAAGLNCGRWDYIFSYIKKLRSNPDVILPDRAIVTMESPFMTAYSLLAIQTCHRRQAYCIGGMAAQIPIKNNPAANEAALEKVRKDKLREALNGHDGTWVAHPGLVPVAMEVFNAHMPGPNQLGKLPEREITAADLLEVPQGPITEAGVRMNISVGIQYLEAWLRGMGAVPINHLMEDAATAEISRAQLWQWIRHPRGVLDDGRKVTVELFDRIFQEELENLRLRMGEEQVPGSRLTLAASLFRDMTVADTFEPFLTRPGYMHLS